MARRGFHPFARVGKAFRSFWRTLSEGDQYAEPKAPGRTDDEGPNRPLPPRPPGVPPPPKRPPREPAPKPPITGGDSLDSGATYPDSWGSREIQLWESEPQTFRGFYTDAEYADLQNTFEHGWLRTQNHTNPALQSNQDKPERDAWRQRFYDLTGGMLPASFDWSAYREYLAEVGSPTVH